MYVVYKERSSGAHQQFENRRRLPAVPLTPRQKFVGGGGAADFCDAERTDVRIRMYSRRDDPRSLPSEREASCDLEPRMESSAECASDEVSP